MQWQRATLVSAAMLLGIVGAPDLAAGGGSQPGRAGHGGGHRHHGHASGGHSGARFPAPYPARVFPYRGYLAAPVAYAPYYYAPPPAYYGAPVAARARPSVSFIPPIDPNAPLFSFNGGAPEPEWQWQRVNLQQLVAEVRAKREAAGKP